MSAEDLLNTLTSSQTFTSAAIFSYTTYNTLASSPSSFTISENDLSSFVSAFNDLKVVDSDGLYYKRQHYVTFHAEDDSIAVKQSDGQEAIALVRARGILAVGIFDVEKGREMEEHIEKLREVARRVSG